MVKRISGTIETENQMTLFGTIRDPDAVMVVKRGASEALPRSGIEGAISYSDGDCAGQGGGGHLGDEGGEEIGEGL